MLQIEEILIAGGCRLILTGHLDLEGTPELKNTLAECIVCGIRLIRVDLARIEQISSSGVGALMNFHNEFLKLGGTLVLENLSPACLHALELLGLGDFFRIE